MASSTISVYLAGDGLVSATVYTASSGGTGVNSVVSDTLGFFSFWVDESDYSNTQLFKVIGSLSGRTSVPVDNIRIFPIYNRFGLAGGTVDTITCTLSSPLSSWSNGVKMLVKASGANTSATPTIAPDGLAAKTIVKGNNAALLAGDIPGAGFWMEFVYDSTLGKVVLQNPGNAIVLVGHNSDGTHKNQLGAWALAYSGTAYQAATDMWLYAGGDSAAGGSIDISIKSDAANPPTTYRARDLRGAVGSVTWSVYINTFVRKGDYYIISVTGVAANSNYGYVPIFT